MNVPTLQRFSPRIGMLLVVTAASIAALAVPCAALAAPADADSGQTVECLLPGQIHMIAGQATMGARRPIQTSPADCREQGGEYTVAEHAIAPMAVQQTAVVSADDGRMVNCLLPRQVRQLGQKARYTTARHMIRTTRSDCQMRGGDVRWHRTTKKHR
jgi:hypothetical protein